MQVCYFRKTVKKQMSEFYKVYFDSKDDRQLLKENLLPSQRLLAESQQWKQQNNDMCEICSNLTIKKPVVLASLLITLYRYYTLFCYFHH